MTEILYDLNLGKNLVAVDSASNFPLAVEKLPKTSHLLEVNKEKVISLKADWILGHDIGFQDLNEKFKKWKIKTKLFPNKKLSDFYSNILSIGKIFDRNLEAKKLVKKIQLHYKLKKQIHYILVLDFSPFIVLGSKNYIEEAFKKCGYINLVTSIGYPKWDKEQSLISKPQKVFIMSDLLKKISINKLKSYWGNQASQISFEVLESDIFSRFTPRFFKKINQICQEKKN